MNVIGRITQIDKKFAWSFSGVLLAIFGLWYSRDNPASLRIELLAKARVYDIHADVPNLAIFFENENIKEKKQVLSIFTVRISNPGGRPITQNLYDTALPFGLRLIDGRAFPPELIEASQKYISENLKPSLIDGGQFHFEKIVFDAKASFTLRFLVLHSQSADPLLKPIGKVAGVGFDDMTILGPPAADDRPSFWRQVVNGSLLVHVVRLFSYVVVIISFIITTFAPIAAIDSIRVSRKRKKISGRFRTYQGSRDSSYADLLAEVAVESGDKGLVFSARLDGLRVSLRKLDRLLEVRIGHDRLIPPEDPFMFTLPLISKLRRGGALLEANGVLRLTPSFKCVLADFQVFWRATEPSDAEATEQFVNRTIQRMTDRPSQETQLTSEGQPGQPHHPACDSSPDDSK